MNNKQKEDTATLEILQAIENKTDVTQRLLADRLGVALGLANSYLKRCVRKGLVKVHHAPANRYLYYLTPQGFAEKSRLTAEYLTSSFDFYRKAGDSLRDVFQVLQEQGKKKIVFCGISELTEIASLRIKEFELEHIATYESNSNLDEFLGKPVWSTLDMKDEADVFVISSICSPENIYKEVRNVVDKDYILVPDIFGFPSKY